jgi:hypothetical protein
MKNLILALLIFSSLEVVCQTDRIVMGTFASGCEVFNYEFRLTPNGLYSFGIDQIKDDVETLFPFDKDTIADLEFNLNVIRDSINTLTSLLKVPDSMLLSRKDSIDLLISDYLNMLQQIKLYMAYEIHIEKIKYQIPALLRNSTKLNLNRYDSLLVIFSLRPKLKTFNRQLEIVVNSGIVPKPEPKTYTLNEFKQETFVPLCENLIGENKLEFQKECENDINMNTLAISIFYQIKAKLELIEDEPITAYLKLKRQTIRGYEYTKNDTCKFESPFLFKVENVSIEFEDGTIKNIFADLSLMDDLGKIIPNFPVVRFKNILPISISSRNDIDYFSVWYLDISDFWAFNSQLEQLNVQGVNEALNCYDSFHKIYIELSDLIDYIDILETNKEDYSPANSVINLNQNNSVVELRKERRSRILTIKTYTDLIGIDDDQPNGLIQFEALRKFNLNTVRKGSYKNRGDIYHAYFSYLEPRLNFSKIEENNNKLILIPPDLDTVALSSNKKAYYILPINLMRYQSTSFDILLNIVKYNFPNIKSNLQFDLAAGIYRTNVSDTIDVVDSKITKSATPNDKTLNTLRFGFSILYEIKPDSRYGLNIVYDFLMQDLLSDQYNFTSNKRYRYSHTIGLEAHLKTNDENTFFFRYKFSIFTPGINEQNYSQIQIGYLVDLFKTRIN